MKLNSDNEKVPRKFVRCVCFQNISTPWSSASLLRAGEREFRATFEPGSVHYCSKGGACSIYRVYVTEVWLGPVDIGFMVTLPLTQHRCASLLESNWMLPIFEHFGHVVPNLNFPMHIRHIWYVPYKIDYFRDRFECGSGFRVTLTSTKNRNPCVPESI